MTPDQADTPASWQGRAAALLLVLATVVLGPPPAAAQSDFPNLPVWSYPGAWHPGAGADTIGIRPRSITVRWLRDPAAEALPSFGGYRIYRATNINGVCDTSSLVLMRRFSRQVQDSLVTWHFPRINARTPLADRVATFIDPDSAGRFVKVRRPANDPCRPQCYDSIMVLIPPPGPHDGFRSWYSVAYEAINTTFNDIEDLFVPGPIEHRSDLGTGDAPVAVATGDLNSDGLLDLVSANSAANTLTIRAGQAAEFCGTAGFGPAIEIPAGQGPRALAVGDLDLDGIPDVVVANRTVPSLSVYRGLGNGELAPSVTINLPGPPSALGLNDLNNDGSLDAAVTITAPPSITLLFGDGNGALAPPPLPIPGSVVSTVTPDALAIWDVDNDRKQDLMIASAASGTAALWLGTGEGRFGVQTLIPAGSGARAVALFDLTGDDNADLVVANGTANSVSVWFGNGDGTFENPGTFPAGGGPASVAVIDINADNAPDLAVADAVTGEISLLYNTVLSDSTSDFGTRTTLPVTGRPVFVVAADLNHEGTPDLAVADSSSDVVNVSFGPSNLNHKAANVANDAWYPTSDPGAPPENRFFAHPVAATGGVRANLSRVGVVPNPYRAVEAWNPDGGHEIHFINLPRDARIRIYTVAGDLVRDLRHLVPVLAANPGQPWDQQRDFEAWDLKNEVGRDVVSGIYIYRVEAANFFHQSRFVIIR